MVARWQSVLRDSQLNMPAGPIFVQPRLIWFAVLQKFELRSADLGALDSHLRCHTAHGGRRQGILLVAEPQRLAQLS